MLRFEVVLAGVTAGIVLGVTALIGHSADKPRQTRKQECVDAGGIPEETNSYLCFKDGIRIYPEK